MATYEDWYRQLLICFEQAADRAVAAQEVLTVAGEIDNSDLGVHEKSALRFVCSSLIINAGVDLADIALLAKGRDLAMSAQSDTTSEQPLHFQCIYNVANAIVSVCDLGLPTAGSWEDRASELVENRRANRVELRQARRMFLTVGSATNADPHTRSAAFCNLANSLDYSGRWAEAYDFYLHALEADPSNGNAAGNLAQLLMNRIQSGVGQTGHIAAVYDKYAKMAQSLRDGTISFAGADIADRWDGLEPTESPGHLAHGLEDPDDEYRKWVAAYRLALSPAVEGLGTDDAHWDSAAIEMLFGGSVDEMSPPILAEMNVLKSDFLVSRQLAYDGYVQVAEGPEQKSDDSGYYVETLDYSLYGLQYSKLFLAQRSALDVLDKTAVVANEHFDTGDEAKRISFRKFWAEKDGQVRPELVKSPQRSLPPYALSELAYDMEGDGMYGPSQALRNAGTHRIVHAAYLEATGVTIDARSRVDLFELVDSTILALQVTRSAYLYLVDLVASWNHPDDHPGTYAPYPSFEYMQLPDDPDQNSPTDAQDSTEPSP
ncbi:tetratricopeptide (TPR) repeat protein [Neomicrococcus aestuarii]|uniref:Tetratricopeptide (TPR) repeat protein n=1 Tax=Neomicrococcus aestuarii TaxID=556325 RepID=A0A7W8WXX9_9MICC|nr:LA2681 family HEPN domain-containing protein [Neomicrococcus aestuarii]MBB5511731.1 tetratricopeptide (TPR) repeat protein [Neomicrococcus aestuarii]